MQSRFIQSILFDEAPGGRTIILLLLLLLSLSLHFMLNRATSVIKKSAIFVYI